VAEFWEEPSDIAARDLHYGVGGPALAPAPDSSFTFVKEKEGGSPGYTVTDAAGTTWHVKMGPEAQAEVAVSRLLWAVGFRQPPVYLLPSWTLVGGPDPGPKGPGRFHPELRGWTEAGSWLWRRNPFVGTRPWRGLIVFMRMVSNWDLLDRNNQVYELDPPWAGMIRFYVAMDLGASLGRSTFPHQGTKNDPEDFENKGRRHRDLYRGISVDDVRWTCDLLAQLRPQQWLDAFRAAHYDQDTAARFIGRLRQKVDDGRRLREGSSGG
jgi:hypothetical protein